MDRQTDFYKKHIERFLNYLPELFYSAFVPLEVMGTTAADPIPFAKLNGCKFRKMHEGEVWGNRWESGWFKLSGTVPRDWTGKTVVARLNFRGEACVFSAAGEPLQGLTDGSVYTWATHLRERFPLASPCKGGEKVELLVEAAANGIFGIFRDDDPVPGRDYREDYVGKLECVRLCVFEEEIWRLYIEARQLHSLMTSLPERDPQRAQILHALVKAANAFRPLAPNPVEARRLLAPVLAATADSTRLATTAVGHAHIDTAWLWPMRETVRKCGRTFSSQLRLIERYPGYVFGASQAQLYQFVKDHYPSLYKRIQRAVADQRWEVQGAMWVEADCNIPSGESLVRQVLYGKKFFKQEFGVDVRNLWLPDVFGYSAALPQILRLAGVDTFLTQKLSWSQFNPFPHHTFIWKGLDGTGILTHFPPENTYNSNMEAGSLRRAAENFRENGYLPEFMTLFGIGDGGGGPLEEHLEAGRLMQNLAGVPRVTFGPAQAMFDRLKEHEAELPSWEGELYLELHRGTYTTQARNKRQNRRLEQHLRRVEILYAALPLADYPAAALERLWKTVLTNQFHDIIPGSSIGQVYVDSQREYAQVEAELRDLEAAALKRLAVAPAKKEKAEQISFVNTLSHSFQGLVHVPGLASGSLEGPDGVRHPLQPAAEGGSWAAVSLPGLASVPFRVVSGPAPAKPAKSKRRGAVLENGLIRYEFSDEGLLVRAFDKETNREVMRKGEAGNRLSLYQDWPHNWDAWDVDITYEQQLVAHAQLTGMEVVEAGPVAQAVKLTWLAGESPVTQTVRLGANSRRLDFVTRVEWKECRKMLRVAFPVDVTASEATYEVQFGAIRRPTHRNTSWDWARFETCGHRFADLSDQQYGVALLNDSKYGYKVFGRTLDLNLLRSPYSPDPTADRGEQLFTYSLLPHTGRFEDSNVLAEAHALNQPVLVADGNVAFRMPVELLPEGVLVETVKKAESEKSWVVRFYEPRGFSASCRLRAPEDAIKIWEAGIIENPLAVVPLREDEAVLHFRPFEIKTILIRQR